MQLPVKKKDAMWNFECLCLSIRCQNACRQTDCVPTLQREGAVRWPLRQAEQVSVFGSWRKQEGRRSGRMRKGQIRGEVGYGLRFFPQDM